MFLTTVLIRIPFKSQRMLQEPRPEKLTTCFVPLTVNFCNCTNSSNAITDAFFIFLSIRSTNGAALLFEDRHKNMSIIRIYELNKTEEEINITYVS
jgi:hypothetical protein